MNPLTHENGKPSGTKTVFSLIAAVIAFRLLVGGVPVDGVVVFPPLDLTGAAALVAAFGSVYAGRRATEAWSARKVFKPPADASGGEHGGNAP